MGKYLKYEDLKDVITIENGERFVKIQNKLVRETVGKMLPDEVILDCGFRSMEEQKYRFEEQMAIYNDVEKAHKYIAEPTVAGHPTGGAVDVYLEGMEIDFNDCDYNPNDTMQYKLRMLMLERGFAPFEGEWWHFSYGDKEWAAYFDKPNAIYEQKDLAYSYKIYSPCGNITALVEGMYEDKKRINNEIQKACPEVEQVGFIGDKMVEMAGGEFCGNASRSAIYYWLNGKPGELKMKCSGCSDVLTGGIDKNNDVYLKGIKIRSIIDNKVEMDGITFFIVPNCENRKEIADKIINENKDYCCVGVIFYTENEITPVVWVRDVNTTYWENSCASGSMAFAAWRGDGEYKIIQPSQDFFKVNVKDSVCEISGKVINCNKL
jgi:diaminopimelate epimerase